MLEDLYQIYQMRLETGEAVVHPHRWLSYRFRLRWIIYKGMSRESELRKDISWQEAGAPMLQIGDRQVFEIEELRRTLRRYQRSSHNTVYLGNQTIAEWYRGERIDRVWAEGWIADNLAADDPSLRLEVATPVGYVDCLSDSQMIEIKQVNRWKEGLGQLCAYACFLPGRERILYLFGQADKPTRLARAREVCRKYSIRVEYRRCDFSR